MRHFSRKVRGLDGLTQAQREYREYLASPLWRAKRQEALDAHGNVCEYCGAKGSCDVHHKRYPSVLGEDGVGSGKTGSGSYSGRTWRTGAL